MFKLLKKILILCLIIVILVGICKTDDIYKFILKKVYPDTYFDYVTEFAEKYDVEIYWIFAIIKAESNFDQEIVSTSGAVRTHAIDGKHG